MYTGKKLERCHGRFFFHSSAVVPRPEFAGRQWAKDAGFIPWHFSSFYLLFSVGVGIL